MRVGSRVKSERRQIGEDRESFEVYAWRVTQALHDWTAKVDTKASVILSLETAVLGLILVFAGAGKPLGHLTGSSVWAFRIGILVLVAAIVTASAAIFPQLNRREARRSWRQNYVYFGHLRRWDPAELIVALEEGSNYRNRFVLSTQMIALSKIIWRKHAFIQWSMSLVALGNIAMLTALLLK